MHPAFQLYDAARARPISISSKGAANHPDYIQETLRFCQDYQHQDEVPFQTSGSTGQPNVIYHPKQRLQASAQRSVAFFGLDAGSKIFLPLSTQHTGGRMALVRAMEHGHKVYLAPAQRTISLPATPMDFASMVPAQLAQLPSTDSHFRKGILLGGGPLYRHDYPPEVPRLYHGFGMTETASHIALRDVHPKPSSIYKALKGVCFQVDASGRLKIDDQVLGIHGLQTNDMVELQSPTSFQWLGRKDDVLLSGGEKVALPALEAELAPLLKEYLGKRAFLVIARPDKTWGQAGVLLIEGEEKIPGDLLDYLKEQIESAKYLKECGQMRSFERTSNFKLKRQASADKYLE